MSDRFGRDLWSGTVAASRSCTVGVSRVFSDPCSSSLRGEQLEDLLLDLHVAPEPHDLHAGAGKPAHLPLDRGQLLAHAAHLLAVFGERLAQDLEA